MTVVNVHEAKSTLSALLAKAERGEDVTIARNGVPVAKLVLIPSAVKRKPGILRNDPAWKGFAYDPALFAPMSEEELAAEGWP